MSVQFAIQFVGQIMKLSQIKWTSYSRAACLGYLDDHINQQLKLVFVKTWLWAILITQFRLNFKESIELEEGKKREEGEGVWINWMLASVLRPANKVTKRYRHVRWNESQSNVSPAALYSFLF